ncbi:MAG: type II secretion system F family protein [Candidatus Omnitrophica bacterium]|nr:type II secretion system F family protein [Candidatus Omnitrophota bacterium]
MAESEQDVIGQLRQLQCTPVKIDRGGSTKVKIEKVVKTPQIAVRPVKTEDLLALCINLSSMISAGITLMGALNVISGQLENPYLGEVVRRVARMVSEGSSLSSALENFPRVFSKFFINMVRVGEISGTMDDVLKTLAVFLEKQDDLRQKIHGALIYPMILIVAGVGVILLIITFVMPQFVKIFEKAGIVLPLPTRMLNGVGVWLRHYWLFFIGGLVALFFLVRYLFEIPKVRDKWQRFILRVPVFGRLGCNVLVARFTRTMGALLNAGVPLLQALTILKEVIDNSLFSEIVQEVRDSAEKGEGLSGPLKKHKEFPADVVYMLSVGEETGKIGPMLNKAADFYENKVEYAIKGLLVYIEPAFISILGVCVGGILASVLLPMFDMIKTIHR